MVRCFLAMKGAALESKMCVVSLLSSKLKLTFPLLIVNVYHFIVISIQLFFIQSRAVYRKWRSFQNGAKHLIKWCRLPVALGL